MEPVDIRVTTEEGKKKLRKLLKFKAMGKDSKNVLFQDYRHVQCRYFRFYRTEDVVKLTMNVYKPRKFAGGQAYVTIENEAYIIYDLKKKKLITNKKENLVTTLLRSKKVTTALGLDAFLTKKLQVPGSFIYHRALISNNVLKAIIKGNCTNFDNAIRRYTKQTFGMSVGVKDISILDNVPFSDAYSMLRVTTNKDNLIRFAMQFEATDCPIDAKHRNLLSDLIYMSLTLCRKVNFAWSANRVEVEHDKLSMEITHIKRKATPIKKVTYKVEPPKIDGITLLTSNHDLTSESELMNHCVGTASRYLEEVLRCDTIIIRYNYRGDRGTAEIKVKKDDLYLAQFNGRYNTTMSQEARERLKHCIEILKESDFGKYMIESKKYRDDQLKIIESDTIELGDYALPF